ncbi:MAG: DUF2834 domain-containing protein, partial [Sinimarinibacterium sp.]
LSGKRDFFTGTSSEKTTRKFHFPPQLICGGITRRLRMRGVWLYLLFGTFIAISVTVPIFLINRERALAAAQPGDTAGTLHPADVAGLVLVGALTLGYTAIALLRSAA